MRVSSLRCYLCVMLSVVLLEFIKMCLSDVEASGYAVIPLVIHFYAISMLRNVYLIESNLHLLCDSES